MQQGHKKPPRAVEVILPRTWRGGLGGIVYLPQALPT